MRSLFYCQHYASSPVARFIWVLGTVRATRGLQLFVGRDAENDEGEIASEKSINALHEKIKALRAEIQASRQNNDAL